MANTDKRLDRHPVARFKVAQHSIGAAETGAVSQGCPMNGRLVGLAVIASNVDNAITYTVTIVDEDSVTLYTLAAQAENATTYTSLTRDNDIFIPDGCNVNVTPSGAPGSAGTVDVILYGV